ncbi:hypothetical protein OAO01_03975 [Oligoflexia bacterium]|nr:hypothetical protein [Oligoflexia bacterium]
MEEKERNTATFTTLSIFLLLLLAAIAVYFSYTQSLDMYRF